MSESKLPQRLIESNKLSCSRLLQGTQSEDAQKPIRTIFFTLHFESQNIKTDSQSFKEESD